MNRPVRLIFTARSLLFLPLLAGCGFGGPARVTPDLPDANSGARAIELFDKNKDGAIAGDEFDAVPGLKAALPYLDTNNSGKLTADDIGKRIKEWRDSRHGRSNFAMTFTHGGQPLVGATVKLVPEPFQGTSMPTGNGVTDNRGTVFVQTTQGEKQLSGISQGFYRVEVTKDGESIPATYNTGTTLGMFVDQQGIKGMIAFDLSY